ATTHVGNLTVAWSNLPATNQIRSITMKMGPDLGIVAWPVGTQFVEGEPPDLDGLTYLVALAEGITVTVFESGKQVTA
ncbi:MAG: hypothetical protein LC687_02250, partial [Actinobacteria bacterium]|nr:hypothetical protein [Actinomycetota bacterium]